MPTTSKTQVNVDQNETPIEPKLSRFARLKRWLGENFWLVFGCLVVLMMAPSAADDAETSQMRANRKQIEAMTQTERDLVLSNFEKWRDMSSQDRKDVRKIHEAVSEDETLSETLSEFHMWLANATSESYEIREKILNEPDAQRRVEIILALIDRDSAGPSDPIRSHTGPDSVVDVPPRQNGMQRNPFPIGFTTGSMIIGRDLEQVMEVIAKWAGVPPAPQNRLPIMMLKHHMTVIEAAGMKLRELRRGPNGVQLPEGLMEEILSAISNPDKRVEVGVMIDGNALELLKILLKSIRYEDLRRIAEVNSQTLRQYFDSLPEDRRQFLYRLPAKERQLRTAWMWVEEKHPGVMNSMKPFNRDSRQLRPNGNSSRNGL